MDTRTSAMVVGLYLAGMGVVVGVGLGYYTYWRHTAPAVAIPAAPSPPAAVRSPSPYPAPATLYQAARAKADESLRQLRASLAESQQQLEQRNQALARKNAECQALKSELDDSFHVILRMLAEEAQTSVERGASTELAKGKLESELSRLVDALNQAESLSVEQSQQLSRLRGELVQADMEFGLLREQAELEIAAMTAERSAFESLVDEVLTRCGAAAVPVVAERLEDERVEVRRWAARTIGKLGPDALGATASLRRSLSDPDAEVREAAERSLRILDGEEVARAAVP